MISDLNRRVYRAHKIITCLLDFLKNNKTQERLIFLLPLASFDRRREILKRSTYVIALEKMSPAPDA